MSYDFQAIQARTQGRSARHSNTNTVLIIKSEQHYIELVLETPCHHWRNETAFCLVNRPIDKILSTLFVIGNRQRQLMLLRAYWEPTRK